jgi:demethylmenaquinone methyltransferase/2-methoxy-6-polyprenyl-1,4-benzoquinol methylase
MEFYTDITISDKSKQSRANVWYMFNRIAGRYDLLNHLLSFGQDILWRKKVASFLRDTTNQHILDLATGTGDQIIILVKKCKNISSAIGIDIAENMLRIAQQKINKNNLQQVIQLKQGDASKIEFSDNTFDTVTISFGIRNVELLKKSLQEILRVLKPGCRFIVLEFSIPQNEFLKRIYLLYLRKILPFMGSLISGDRIAYRYLNQTIENFPWGNNFLKLLSEAGFCNCGLLSLTFGIATIYYADKQILQ